MSSPPIHSEALTCLPRCSLPPHPQCRSAPLVYTGRHCESPHKGTLVAQQGGSGDGCGEPNIYHLLCGGTIDAERYTPLQSVPVLCNTCTGSIFVWRLGPLTLLIDQSRPRRERSGEWWMRWELRLLIWVQASYIFQERSSSHRPWVGVA